MERRPFTSDLIASLHKHERMLLRRHGVRLRVDKITADGKSALCSIAEVRRPWFRSSRSAEELIDLAHVALMPLHRIGLSALISPLSSSAGATFAAVEEKDPFAIRLALHDAALEEMILHLEQGTATMRKSPIATR